MKDYNKGTVQYKKILNVQYGKILNILKDLVNHNLDLLTTYFMIENVINSIDKKT